MKLPRDVSGDELIKRLEKLDYIVTRQTGSHVRLSRHGEHYVTIPRHRHLRVGTLSGVDSDVAEYLGMTKEEVIKNLWE